MSLNRRAFLGRTAALTGTALTGSVMAPSILRAADVFNLGSILDTSGIFDAYGKPMDQALRLAVSEINAAGGSWAKRSPSPPMTPNPTWRFIRNTPSN